MSAMNWGIKYENKCFFCPNNYVVWFVKNDTTGPMLNLCKSCWDQLYEIRLRYNKENSDS